MTSRSMCIYIYRTAMETSTVYIGVWGSRGSKQHTWHHRNSGNEESQ